MSQIQWIKDSGTKKDLTDCLFKLAVSRSTRTQHGTPIWTMSPFIFSTLVLHPNPFFVQPTSQMFMCKGFILCPDSNWFLKLVSPWNMLCFKDHVDYKHIFLYFPNLTYFSQVVIHFFYCYLQKFLKEPFKIFRNFLLEAHATGLSR